jgi:hypothetical protein
MAKRLLEQVAQVVARNELFEKPGDRPRQAPLPDDAWLGASADAEDKGAVE